MNNATTASQTPPLDSVPLHPIVMPETLADGTKLLWIEETETTKYVPYIHGQTGNLCLCIMDKRTGHAVSINVRNARTVLERLEREASA